MNRAETSDGEMITARASAGRSIPRSMVTRTFTRSLPGSIESIRPTFTPSTRTSSPLYRPEVDGKYAVMLVVPSRVIPVYAPNATSATTTAPATTTAQRGTFFALSMRVIAVAPESTGRSTAVPDA
ncbi:hypothetical protein NBRGN_043_00370 [Nocardia brasiliensis NBRC 14402]|nr:hypothetical protein NBRGN_043_00370 [Nocardia brasiliensis NBRC 14402]